MEDVRMPESNVFIGPLQSFRRRAGLCEVAPAQRCQQLRDFRSGLERMDGFNCRCQNRPVMLVRERASEEWGPTIMIDWRTYEVVPVEPVDPTSTTALENMVNNGALSIAVGSRAQLLLFLTGYQINGYQPDDDLNRLAQTTFGHAVRCALLQKEVTV